MGNPHPTKSKPFKIGRKHTGAIGVRQKGRLTSTSIARNKLIFRKFKAEVVRYWNGERDTYPSK